MQKKCETEPQGWMKILQMAANYKHWLKTKLLMDAEMSL